MRNILDSPLSFDIRGKSDSLTLFQKRTVNTPSFNENIHKFPFLQGLKYYHYSLQEIFQSHPECILTLPLVLTERESTL